MLKVGKLKNNSPLFLLGILFCMIGQVSSQSISNNSNQIEVFFSELNDQLTEGNLDSVLILCDKMLSYASPLAKGIAYFYQGQVAALTGRISSAATSIEQAEEIFKSRGFDKGLAMLYIKKADLLYMQGETLTADKIYDQSIQLSRQLNLHETLADAYQKKANIASLHEDSESAIAHLKIALDFAKMEMNQSRIRDIINEISTNYHATGQLDSAIIYFSEGLRVKLEIDDLEGSISDYITLGSLYRERGSYEEAQKNLVEALQIAEGENDTLSLMTIYSELGDIYTSQYIWNVAESYYDKVLALAKVKNSPFTEAGCYKKLGEIYHVQKKDSLAIESLEMALIIYDQFNNKTAMADVLISLSQIYQDGNQFVKAKNLLLDALTVRNASHDLLSILSTKLALAEIEIRHGNAQRGIVYAEECLPSYRDMDEKEGLRKTYLLLSDAYALIGSYKKAYQFHLDFKQVNDSLTSIDRAQAIKKYDLLYTSEKKDKEIAEQKEQIRSQEVDILAKKNQLLILGGGVVLIGLLSALLFFINYKNKQLSHQKIKVLKKEKETQGLKAFIEGEEKERKRMARELHDGLGAALATVKMQISSIGHQMPKLQSTPTYQKAESLIDDACKTVREISHDLMPHVLEQQGLKFAMEDLCQNLLNNSDVHIDFILFGNDQRLDAPQKLAIFRITQELLKNIIQHAQAKEVIVQLTMEEDEIILIVEDDGKGFDSDATYRGIGLQNISSRTAYLNGILNIDSVMGQGSTFTIQLPLSENKKK